MGRIKKIIILSISLIPLINYAQNCGLIAKSIVESKSKYYLLDTNTYDLDFNPYYHTINPADTALFRLIIEKGTHNESCIEFWDSLQKVKIIGSRVSKEQFFMLSPDVSNFSDQEVKEFKKLKKYIAKSSLSNISDKRRERIVRYLNSENNINLIMKMWNTYPKLISILPCFTYQNYKLKMCFIMKGAHLDKTLYYEICEN